MAKIPSSGAPVITFVLILAGIGEVVTFFSYRGEKPIGTLLMMIALSLCSFLVVQLVVARNSWMSLSILVLVMGYIAAGISTYVIASDTNWGEANIIFGVAIGVLYGILSAKPIIV